MGWRRTTCLHKISENLLTTIDIIAVAMDFPAGKCSRSKKIRIHLNILSWALIFWLRSTLWFHGTNIFVKFDFKWIWSVVSDDFQLLWPWYERHWITVGNLDNLNFVKFDFIALTFQSVGYLVLASCVSLKKMNTCPSSFGRGTFRRKYFKRRFLVILIFRYFDPIPPSFR